MNDRSVGVEIDATAKWLEERGIVGAAGLLRRVARQRDDAVRQLGLHPASAAHQTGSERPAPRDLDAAAEAAMLRTDLARLQTLAERAGWVPDPAAKRLWRWRDGWWELGHRRRSPKDGYHDTGWYLWGPVGSYDGEWVDRHKAPAMAEAERLISKHLSATGEGQR
ncbi:hypothetical protein [Streptomyces sp. SAJ15]|uniref:hypothetical protein n=1 Tax=Streptomyces sp. SAJ15 TaxID=2011095 RepID=UPI001186E0DB|nr:hypothetical protein [Streptomyces sp. SAJ15]TVL92035.1 hypothetical protein CD790_15340 [Streptomyces sp. SAJ15]